MQNIVIRAATVAALCSLSALAQAQFSTAYGQAALSFNANDPNDAFGYCTLNHNTTGGSNVGFGYEALFQNTTGFSNSAFGTNALANNNGSYNSAFGEQALFNNTTGNNNVASGCLALFYNNSGSENVAIGANSLFNATGNGNSGFGYESLYSSTGSYNNGTGYETLYNTTGSYNIAMGFEGGYNVTTGSFNIDIGSLGLSTDNGIIRIGTAPYHTATYIAGIHGVTASGGVEVFINANGQLGTVLSSRRFKNQIKDMGMVSDKLMQLRPVTFRYKDSAEKGKHALQYGLIAEEVAKVYPDLVQYDKQGRAFTIYYHLLTPMILNELQKEHRQNVAMKAAFTTQKAELAAMKSAHKAEMTSMMARQKAEITALKTELAALKQDHEQEMKTLARLSASVRTAQAHETQPHVAFAQH
jgi:hypothetical protein